MKYAFSDFQIDTFQIVIYYSLQWDFETALFAIDFLVERVSIKLGVVPALLWRNATEI